MNTLTKMYFELYRKTLEFSWEITFDSPDDIAYEFLQDLEDAKEQTQNAMKEYADPESENDDYIVKLGNEIITLCDNIEKIEKVLEALDFDEDIAEYLKA